QRPDHAGQQPEQRRGEHRLLHEVVGQQVRGGGEVEHLRHHVGEFVVHARASLSRGAECGVPGSPWQCAPAAPSASIVSPVPTTTSRPRTRSTSTSVWYSSDSTSEVITSSGVPIRNLPSTRYSTRSTS